MEIRQTLVSIEMNMALVIRQELLERCPEQVREMKMLHVRETFEESHCSVLSCCG